MDDSLLTLRQRNGFVNIREAARLIDIRVETLRHNIEHGRVPRPGHRVGRRYYYTDQEVAKIAALFAERRRYKRHDE